MMMLRDLLHGRAAWCALLPLLAVLFACGDDPRMEVDGGGGTDAMTEDAMPDDAPLGIDVVMPPMDAAVDMGTDAAADSGPMHCMDGVRSGDESDTDCGGPTCAMRCDAGGSCFLNGDCSSGVCIGGRCEPARCSDGIQNGEETGRDCGGPCPGCPLGGGCVEMDDCLDGVCDGGFCQASHCFNTTQDADETDVDCGGNDCAPCGGGAGCDIARDCLSAMCVESVCVTVGCTNGELDPGEVDVDCGGPDCRACDDGSMCSEDVDCISRRCDVDTCTSCVDGVLNGDEVDVDCGGDCRGCPSGTDCTRDEDCASRECVAGVCEAAAPSCLALLQADPELPSGVYEIQPDEAAESVLVYCDMDTDGGGWTLVASTRTTTLDDQSLPYHDELQTLNPTAGHAGIWDGFRALMLDRTDIRFACKRDTGAAMHVDMSFYANNWYGVLTSSPSDASVCFHPGFADHDADLTPARRNNLTGAMLPMGDTWTRSGGLEAEDSCTDTGDFTIDFDEGGMDTTSPTDWGEDDTVALCGTNAPGGAWFVFVREATCFNGELDPGETNIDCGGVCPGCMDGAMCMDADDCASGRCEGDRCNSCSDGLRNGDEVGMDCGGPCPGCLGGVPCTMDADCASFDCTPGGTCADAPRSCVEILQANPSAPSGPYAIVPDPGLGAINVYCDMDTDGGGWTLVASTSGTTLNDQASSYYDDLATLTPTEGHEGIFSGMRELGLTNTDIRFACRQAASGVMNVDMSFYDNNWYDVLTASTSDASVCFHPGFGAHPATLTPERRDNLSGAYLPEGDPWTRSGGLEGEDSCTDTGDFTIDFDEGGMDTTSPTDWGEDDSSALCAGFASGGSWFIFYREALCSNGELDPGEVAIDCGGACRGCPDGTACTIDRDCASDRCDVDTCTSCDDGVRNGDEAAIDCGGDCVGCPGGTLCDEPADCASRGCTAGTCDPVASTCRAILLNDPSAPDGVYTIQPDPGADPVDVYCDMTTDGGGWTLVGSTSGTTFNDQASDYYDDLTTITPGGGHEGIWDGMRLAAGSMSDLRVSCRAGAGTAMEIDMSFYGNNWYETLTSSTNDSEVCFHPGFGEHPATIDPARRDNVSGAELPAGDPWTRSGSLEAEDSCTDTGDFTLDFDEGGMDTTSPTDWGEDDSSRLCGPTSSAGSWFVWVREQVPDLRVRVIPDPANCGAALVEVRNVGGSRFDEFDLTLTVDGGAPTVETVSMPLEPGERFERSVPGSSSVEARIAASGDADPSNDVDAAALAIVPLGAGIALDFELDDGGFTVDGMNPSWEHGAPRGAFIDGAASGAQAWVTGLEGDYNVNEQSRLMSPCYDFGAAAADPVLTFSHIYRTEACCDEGFVEISLDGGMSWNRLGAAGTGTNWYNDATNNWWDGASGVAGAWRTASHVLTGSAGARQVRLRFVMSSDDMVTQEGFGVDDVTITE